MSEINIKTSKELSDFVERIERLEEEKARQQDCIKAVYAEAKSVGFDTKALRQIIRERKQEEGKREEHEAVVNTYREALTMFSNTPMGAYIESQEAA